jgi:hypothetical protein
LAFGFDDDHIAGVDEHLGDQRQALLGALEDDHVVRAAHHTVRRHPCRDRAPQGWQPVSHGVLEGAAILPTEDPVEDLTELCGREERGIRVSAAERDDVGVGAVLEQVPDRRGSDDVHAGGVPGGHHAAPVSSALRPRTSSS